MTGLVVTAFAVPVTASASAADNHYEGFAMGEVAHVDALELQGTKVANVEVAKTDAAVNNDALANGIYNEFNRPIVPKGFTSKNSYGDGSPAEVGLGVGPDDPDQIPGSLTQASSAGGRVFKDDDPIHVPASPLLWADALHGAALANWNQSTCVIGEPISGGAARVAAAEVLNIDSAMGTNADDSFKQALVHAGVAESFAQEQLYPGSSSTGGLGLASVAASHAVHLVLLKGTATPIKVDVAPAFLVVKVDGVKHSKLSDNIIYDAPLVTITPPGQDPIKILPDQVTAPNGITIEIPPGASQAGSDLLLKLEVATLDELMSKSGPSIKTLVNGDGTAASASVNVLRLQLLNIPEIPGHVLDLSVGHLEAAAKVPANGINCPIPVTKTPDVTTVESGKSFTTTIEVKNPWACPLVLSSVTDTIDTIEGTSTFSITDTSPTAQEPASLPTDQSDHGVVKWNKNMPTIDPGKSAIFTVTLKTAGGAGKIKDIAEAAGAVTNCKPGPGQGETTVEGVTNVKVPVTGTGTLVVPETKVLGKVLGVTGVADTMYGWVGMLMLLTAISGGFALRRRRFKIEG